MKYIVKDVDGDELGPYEQKEIEQYILERRIDGKTEIRTDLLPNWSRLEKVGIFAKTLAAVPPLEKTPEEIEAERPKTLGEKTSQWLCIGYKEVIDPSEKDTAFKNRPVPQPGGPVLRLMAGLTDFAILLLLMLGMVMLGINGLYSTAESATTQVQPEAEVAAEPPPAPAVAKNAASTTDATPEVAATAEQEAEATEMVKQDNLTATAAPTNNDSKSQGYSFGSAWVVTGTGERFVCIDDSVGMAKWVPVEALGSMLHWYLAYAVFIFALYYGLGLGYYAQTIGMWFWGLFVVKKDNTEVHFFRAALFSMLVPWFGWLTIFTGWFGGWGVHDHLSGVKVLKTVPRSRY